LIYVEILEIYLLQLSKNFVNKNLINNLLNNNNQ